MEKNTIFINKSLIPYTFNIVLGGEEFTIRVDYNKVGRFFSVGVSKNGVTLCSGEPIVYGRKLFSDVWAVGFPAVDIVPYDPSGRYNAVTYSNLCNGVLLVVDNEETSVLGG